MNVYNLESWQLIDSAFMRNLMGDEGVENFIFENGFYPRIDETHLAASPILLYPGENADSVVMPFYVDTSYGVYWYSHDYRVIRIEGNIGYVRHPIKETTTVKIEARSNREYEKGKHVYLTVPASRLVYQDLKADTVCPCDSVKMINTYARNKGWNYEVVETSTAEYNTIYRMYLHHYPTYKELAHRAAVERDSMPYIYGKDTIRNFGLTELRRYPTVHGCDSILCVQLDTLYVHRERHFRDSLHTCAGDTLYWRGHEITQSGNYTDTVHDLYRGGTDSIYHLRAAIHPTFHTAHTDSCYIEELPYGMDGRQVADFGHHTDRHVTASGCDSVHEYVLSRRWHYYKVQVKVRGDGEVAPTFTTMREDEKFLLRFTAAPCHILDSLKIDGEAVTPQESYLLTDLHGDCLVEAVFSEIAPTESVLRYEACADSLPVRYNGEAYGAGEHEIRFTNAAGCDSIVRLNVREKRNAARIAVTDTITPPCGANAIPVSYRVETGSPQQVLFRYDAAAHAAGFRDTAVDIRGGERKTDLPLPPGARPDRYTVQLWQADVSGCYAQDETLTFEIPYPSSIIVQKWNDVLAVLSPE
ncbi:MAG: hypothetical protein NC114_09270, partial [Ruminococcus flavefaciens]|nr:hypothetical protein [Ruminococcus flavefaciens]